MLIAHSRRVLPILGLALSLAACGSTPKEEFVERPVEQLYNQATDSLVDAKYVEAAKGFDEVERQHPYSSWATKAQLMAAYANYQANKYDEAIGALDRFISLHPGNADAAYAYYLKGICYYEQITDVGRDQELTNKALAAFQEVIKRFPDTTYAKDARVKNDLAVDHLAGKEMSIGRYYQRGEQYVAAINRFRRVIEQYQTTTHVPEALERLTECYLALGLKDEAQAAAAVLGYNFPGSEWYQSSYALLTGEGLAPKGDNGSWISRALNVIF